MTKPLDASSFVADPCKSLTRSQRTNFTLDDGEPLLSKETNVPGEGCIYRNRDAQVSIDVAYMPDIENGLSHFYAQNEAGWFEYWEPTEVDGYPAAIGMTERPGTDCNLYVGLTDSLSFSVSVIAQTGDGRTAAENVASAVLETIKAGGA